MAQIRQNYHEECEAAINKQINLELYASYVYMTMAYHFDRDDVASKGYFQYFKKQSDEEREHAQKFMEYQNLRGGSIVLHDIKAPATISWNRHHETLEDALKLEKQVNESLLSIHKLASTRNDPHLTNFLEDQFLDEQVQALNEISKLLTEAKRCGKGLGEYQFDKNTMLKM